MLAGVFPYDVDKNLGKAYNETFQKYDDEDWLIIKDHDVLILLPETIKHIHEYIKLYPGTGIFTCFTNRIANSEQLLNGKVNEDDSIRIHIGLALKQLSQLYKITELKKPVSGMLMVIKKEVWNEVKFAENALCLGVDNDYHLRMIATGRKILRMDGIYVWHTYRLINGIKDKRHLV